MPDPYLSIIIPAFNEAHRLPITLEKVAAFIREQPYSSEVIVVESGSQDETFQIAQDFAEQHEAFWALHIERRGKGLAVQRGILASRGEYRFMCDADLSMPIEEVNRFLPPMLTDFDVAIASREAVGAVRYNEPFYRHIGGRAINFVIRTFALPGLNDTQCGFKCFRGDVAMDLFQSQTLEGWSFDIEILYIARQRGYKIQEVPIPWYFNPESKLNVFKDAIRMYMDILVIRRNASAGIYDDVSKPVSS